MTDQQAALIISVCLNAEPRSVTWLVFETGLKPQQVSRALRLLDAQHGCRWIPGRGFIYWSEEAEAQLLRALADDVCRSLIGSALRPSESDQVFGDTDF